jgi:hypothetical protein
MDAAETLERPPQPFRLDGRTVEFGVEMRNNPPEHVARLAANPAGGLHRC